MVDPFDDGEGSGANGVLDKRKGNLLTFSGGGGFPVKERWGSSRGIKVTR